MGTRGHQLNTKKPSSSRQPPATFLVRDPRTAMPRHRTVLAVRCCSQHSKIPYSTALRPFKKGIPDAAFLGIAKHICPSLIGPSTLLSCAARSLTCAAYAAAMGSVDQPHVALLAFPFGTHASPLFSLARAFAGAAPAGAAFSFLTSPRSAASLPRPSSGENIRIVEISDGGHVSPAEEDPEAEVRVFMGETPENFRKGMEAAVKAAGGARVTCVVSDVFLWFSAEMAAEMGVPWVALWTGGPCSLSAHLYTNLLRREIGVGDQALQSKGDKELDFVPGLSGLRARDLPEGIVSGKVDGVFAKLLHRMGQELHRATAVALNSFQGLNADLDADFASKFRNSLPIGPLNLLNPNPADPDRSGCLEWLDRHEMNSVVYISFGSFMCPRPSELAELAAGLEASGVPFLWSLKDSAKEQLPDGFLDRTREWGLVVPWAPQVRVLEHGAVGAFLTHCGWNSVLESVTCGVPMVCRPFLGDQMLNARAISHVWRVGVGLDGEGMRKDDVAAALGKVLKGEEGAEMRGRIRILREDGIHAVSPNGSSTHNFKALVNIVISR